MKDVSKYSQILIHLIEKIDAQLNDEEGLITDNEVKEFNIETRIKDLLSKIPNSTKSERRLYLSELQELLVILVSENSKQKKRISDLKDKQTKVLDIITEALGVEYDNEEYLQITLEVEDNVSKRRLIKLLRSLMDYFTFQFRLFGGTGIRLKGITISKELDLK